MNPLPQFLFYRELAAFNRSRVLAYRIAFVAVPLAIAVVLALHALPPLTTDALDTLE